MPAEIECTSKLLLTDGRLRERNGFQLSTGGGVKSIGMPNISRLLSLNKKMSVLIGLRIDKDGSIIYGVRDGVEYPKIWKSSNSEFSTSIMEALKGWKFYPAFEIYKDKIVPIDSFPVLLQVDFVEDALFLTFPKPSEIEE